MALLEELARQNVGWPARAVEYRALTGTNPSINFLNESRSSNIDLRSRNSLVNLNTPFESLPRTVDIRRPNSHRTSGRHNLLATVLFACRRKIDSATLVPSCHVSAEQQKRQTRTNFHSDLPLGRTFDREGKDSQLHILCLLYTSPSPRD